MERSAYIYGLVDPRDGQVRYVGKSNNPRVRLAAHIHGARYGAEIRAHAWVADVLAFGLRPQWFVIEEVAQSAWKEAERYWIGYLRYVGVNLTNVSGGGNDARPAGWHHRPESCVLMSAQRKGKPSPRLGHKATLATREKMSRARRGKSLPVAADDPRQQRYVVIKPDGAELEVLNLARFCRQHGLNNSSMGGVVTGRQAHHRGWRCRRA